MKSMKKCAATNKNIINYKRRSSAGLFNTSSAGAVTSLILVVACFASVCLINFFNSTDTYAANLSLSITGSATVDIAPLSSAGDFAKSGDVTISASTDGAFGYQLMIQAANSTNLVSSSNDTIASLPTNTSITENAFSAGGYNGKWGYKPSMYNSVSNSTYRPSPPTSTGDIINVTNCANGTSGTTCTNNTDNYTFNIGTKVNMDQPFGEYSNTFNVILISNAVDYSITYNSSMVTNMPTDVSGTVDTNTVTISSDIPVRDGYRFLGWCTVVPAADGSCSGTSYAAGGTYTLGNGSNNLVLYARWGEPICKAQTCMQAMTASDCTTTPKTVYDSRDEQAYTVQRLNDGKCWMTKNLNLPGGTALSADDTDVTSTYISGFTTGGNLTKSGDTIVLPASTPTGTSIDENYYNDTSNAVITNSGSETCASNTPCYSYYSWIAATLGGKRADGRTTEARNGYNTAASICPKGWRLPTATTSNRPATTDNNWKTGDFYALATAYGVNLESRYSQSTNTFYSNTSPSTTPNFLLTGYYYRGSFSWGGVIGDYWSSTSSSTTGAYNFNLYSNSVDVAGGSSRRYGYGVRCLLAE